jgi:MFS family permease
MARRGVISCAVGLVMLSMVPHFTLKRSATAVSLLQMAAICLAFTSATVVSSLTSFASLQCDEVVDQVTGKPVQAHPQLSKGVALGVFRSAGQLGRAIGPLLGAWFRNGQSVIPLSRVITKLVPHTGPLVRRQPTASAPWR